MAKKSAYHALPKVEAHVAPRKEIIAAEGVADNSDEPAGFIGAYSKKLENQVQAAQQEKKKLE